jgi:hypothetical protein
MMNKIDKNQEKKNEDLVDQASRLALEAEILGSQGETRKAIKQYNQARELLIQKVNEE